MTMDRPTILSEAKGLSRRGIERVVAGTPTSDGAGVRLTRLIGTAQLPDLDPFLLLDEFRSDDAGDYIAGFPDHPHRGFETVTYMLAGRMRHADNRGNSGLLRAGGAQWMTAGRGIVHSEMPEQQDGLMWGFQLWVNLPAAHKMTEPRYQDIAPEAIPEVPLPEGGRVRVVAGVMGDVRGPVTGIATDPVYLDVALPAGQVFAHALPVGHTAFIYLYDGAVSVGGTALRRGDLGVLGDGTRVEIESSGRPARLLLVAGRPLREPIARWGPFVMNTPEQIRQAIADYQMGRF
ncbi:MAG TPA: pirin family protein [Alphaproteobacteria bacterium]